MEGFLVMMPKGQSGESGSGFGPRLILDWVEKDQVWRSKVRTKLEWRGTTVGSFNFGLEVAEIQ